MPMIGLAALVLQHDALRMGKLLRFHDRLGLWLVQKHATVGQADIDCEEIWTAGRGQSPSMVHAQPFLSSCHSVTCCSWQSAEWHHLGNPAAISDSVIVKCCDTQLHLLAVG